MRTVASGMGALRTVRTIPETIVVKGVDTPSTFEVEFTTEFAWQKAPTGSTANKLSTPEHNPIVFTSHPFQWQAPIVCDPVLGPTHNYSSSLGTRLHQSVALKKVGSQNLYRGLPRTPLGCSCELQNVATLRGERMLYERKIKSR